MIGYKFVQSYPKLLYSYKVLILKYKYTVETRVDFYP